MPESLITKLPLTTPSDPRTSATFLRFVTCLCNVQKQEVMRNRVCFYEHKRLMHKKALLDAFEAARINKRKSSKFAIALQKAFTSKLEAITEQQEEAKIVGLPSEKSTPKFVKKSAIKWDEYYGDRFFSQKVPKPLGLPVVRLRTETPLSTVKNEGVGLN